MAGTKDVVTSPRILAVEEADSRKHAHHEALASYLLKMERPRDSAQVAKPAGEDIVGSESLQGGGKTIVMAVIGST